MTVDARFSAAAIMQSTAEWHDVRHGCKNQGIKRYPILASNRDGVNAESIGLHNYITVNNTDNHYP